MTGSRPWGFKVTSHLYFEGEPSESLLSGISDTLNNVTPNATFHGMTLEEVQDEPRDQVGS